MRNLQKILALVMAMVMSFSLLATVNAADFPDAGDINSDYSNAVTVLSGLGVFQGYKEDGTFRPKGNITRAEVAAIIYRIVTGDVNDTQKDIYSSWGKFNDVLDGSWYAGYVNYCANAGYIKGYNNTTFGPNDQVTGYQALAMILRAVGYDKNGEFTGSQWQIRTASIARERGVTKNVTDTLLGQAATRETVAELLFRSIVIPKVKFNANTLSYDEMGKKDTLGYESLELEEVTGIVTGNEYADLESKSVLNSDKTRMRVDGEAYVLDWGEENLLDGLAAIGEERNAYIQHANKTSAKVLVMERTDKNKTYETLGKVDIKSDSDFRSKTGYQRVSSTQQFVNFDKGVISGEWKSDWRIKYVVSLDDEGNLFESGTVTVAEANAVISEANYKGFTLPKLSEKTNNVEIKNVATDNLNNGYSWDKANKKLVYTQEFRINQTIPSDDRNNIEEIFNVADKVDGGVGVYVDGEVYAGTTSMQDVSDIMSLSTFVKDYINTNSTETVVNANENGNWLKVIDNDNDGQAEYVLKLVYTMAQVVKSKDGKYALDIKTSTKDGGKLTDEDACNSLNNIGNDDVLSEDSLALDDIVYYAVIDGKARATKAETATVKLNTVNRKDLNVTTTDGTEYVQSGVHGNHVVSPDYSWGVTNMSGTATYTIYLDRGGYLALFGDSNNGDFKLIVDGWYNETKSGTEYAARVYNDETGRLEVVDVTRGGSLFMSGDVQWKGIVQNNDWRALKWLGDTTSISPDNSANAGPGALNGDSHSSSNSDQVKSTVATLNSDGVMQPVDYTSTSEKEIRMLATDGNVVPSSAASYNAKVYETSGSLRSSDTAYDHYLFDAEVRALSSTVYYLVYPSSNSQSGYSVERYVGYSNVPKNINNVEDVYVVGTRQTRDSSIGSPNYYTANVVVVELSSWRDYAKQVFIYDMPIATNGVHEEKVSLIYEDGTLGEVMVDFDASEIRGYRVADVIGTNGGYNGTYGTDWAPGLYYLYPTDEDGLYRVKQMDAADIAANDYVVGVIDTSKGTSDLDYISVLGIDENDVAYGMTVASIGNENLYTLSYDSNWIADLGQYSRSDFILGAFLSEQSNWEESSNNYGYWDHNPRYTGIWDDATCNHTGYWNQNRVLVHYTTNSRGEHVANYAISFANMKGSGRNAAYSVWNNLKPAQEIWTNADAATIRAYAEFMVKWANLRPIYHLENGRAMKAMAQYLWDSLTGKEQAGVTVGSELYDLLRALDPNFTFGSNTPVVPDANETAINNADGYVEIAEGATDASEALKALNNALAELKKVANPTAEQTAKIADLQKTIAAAAAKAAKDLTADDKTLSEADKAELDKIVKDLEKVEDEDVKGSLGEITEVTKPEEPSKDDEIKIDAPDGAHVFDVTDTTATVETAKVGDKLRVDPELILSLKGQVEKAASEDGKYTVYTVVEATEDNKGITVEVKEGYSYMGGVWFTTNATTGALNFVPFSIKLDQNTNARKAVETTGENWLWDFFLMALNDQEKTYSMTIGEFTWVGNWQADGSLSFELEGDSNPADAIAAFTSGEKKDFTFDDGTTDVGDETKVDEIKNVSVDDKGNVTGAPEDAKLYVVNETNATTVKGWVGKTIGEVDEDAVEILGTPITGTTVSKEDNEKYVVAVQTNEDGDIIAVGVSGAINVKEDEEPDDPDDPVSTSKLTVEAVGPEEKLLGNMVALGIQKDVKVKDNGDDTFTVEGVSKYVTEWTAFSSVAAEQNGYYVALKFAHSDVANTSINIIGETSKKTTPLTDDGILIWKITPKENKGNKITVKVGRDTYTVDLAGMTLGEETDNLAVEAVTAGSVDEAYVYAESGKKVDAMHKEVTVSELEGDTFKVTGTLKYIAAPGENPNADETKWTDFWGTNYNSGYYVALKMSFPGITSDKIKFTSTDGTAEDANSPKLKSLKADGLLVWHVTPNKNGQASKNITVYVQGKTYTIDLSAVNCGSSDTLSVQSAKSDADLLKKTSADKPLMTVPELQENITATDPVNGVITVTGKVNYVDQFYGFNGSEDSGGYYIALDIVSWDGTVKYWLSSEYGMGKGHEIDPKDNILIWNIKEDKSNARIIVEAGGIKYSIDLSGVELAEKDVEESGITLRLKPFTGSITESSYTINATDYQTGVKIDNDLDDLTVTGTLFYQESNSLYQGDEAKGFFLAMRASVNNPDGDDVVMMESKLLGNSVSKKVENGDLVVCRVAAYKNGTIDWNTLTFTEAQESSNTNSSNGGGSGNSKEYVKKTDGKTWTVDLSDLTLGSVPTAGVITDTGDIYDNDNLHIKVIDIQTEKTDAEIVGDKIVVTGEAKLITNWVAFNGKNTPQDEAERNGYYVALKLKSEGSKVFYVTSRNGDSKAPDGSGATGKEYKKLTTDDGELQIVLRVMGNLPGDTPKDFTIWIDGNPYTVDWTGYECGGVNTLDDAVEVSEE